MKKLICAHFAMAILGLSGLAHAATEDAVHVMAISSEVAIEGGEAHTHATVILRIRDLGPEKDVGIVLNTPEGDSYRPGIYAGTAEYGYEIWKVDTDFPGEETVDFLGVHRIGRATYIDDNQGAFYSFKVTPLAIH